MMRKIVLASASPRRKEILQQTGLRFSVDAGDQAELLRPLQNPRALARAISLGKARSAAARHRNAIVIAADTFIVFKGRLFGKPLGKAAAVKMLSTLSGRMHLVITGFTIIDTAVGRSLSRSAATQVYFRRLSPKDIQAYVASGEPLDKAGAYAIQGLGALLVKKIEGDYYNVVGLPIALLVESLKKFGICVPFS